MLDEFGRQPQGTGAAYALSLRAKMRVLLQTGGCHKCYEKEGKPKMRRGEVR